MPSCFYNLMKEKGALNCINSLLQSPYLKHHLHEFIARFELIAFTTNNIEEDWV